MDWMGEWSDDDGETGGEKGREKSGVDTQHPDSERVHDCNWASLALLGGVSPFSLVGFGTCCARSMIFGRKDLSRYQDVKVRLFVCLRGDGGRMGRLGIEYCFGPQNGSALL